MNIFVLDTIPQLAAESQCDVHVIKMILESAQLLCTAHRILDGTLDPEYRSPSGRRQKYWVHPKFEDTLYKATHVNHPCAVWARECMPNYMWLRDHFYSLCDEYEYRFKKVHSTHTKLDKILAFPPTNIPRRGYCTDFPVCMPDSPVCESREDVVRAYRAYYKTKRDTMKRGMIWTKRNQPNWF